MLAHYINANEEFNIMFVRHLKHNDVGAIQTCHFPCMPCMSMTENEDF